jgi:hypothetical protein
VNNLARALTPQTDEPLPDALADVARVLGEALAAQVRADNSWNPKETAAVGIRKAAPPAGFNPTRT